MSGSRRVGYPSMRVVSEAREERVLDSKQNRRERRVRALLETLNDPYELPRREQADAGPAPSRRVPCPACRRTGKVTSGEGIRTCLTCSGTGWRRRRPGEQEWDEYLNLPVSTAQSVVKARSKPFKLDEDIRRLSSELERLEARDDPRSDELLRALPRKEWFDRRGSYRELRRALDVLASRSRCVYDAIHRRYLRNVPVEMSPHVEQLVAIGVTFLAREMRGEIRVPHAWRETEAEQIQRSVLELADRGRGHRAIARELGVPLKRVKSILGRAA